MTPDDLIVRFILGAGAGALFAIAAICFVGAYLGRRDDSRR